MNTLRHKDLILKLALITAIWVFLFSKVAFAKNNPGPISSTTKGDLIEITVEFSAPLINKAGEYDHIEMFGIPSLGNTGEPVLPVRGVNILIPAGKDVKSSELVLGEKVALPGKYNIEPAQKPVPLSYKGPTEKTLPKDDIYKSKNPYPKDNKEKITTQKMRGYRIEVFKLCPIEYIPGDGMLSYYKSITLKVILEKEKRLKKAGKEPRPRGLRRDKSRLEKFISNTQDIVSYDAVGEEQQTGDMPLTGEESGTLTFVNPAESYQYVVITNEALKNAPGPYNFQALCAEKEARGITTNIVTTEWIYANYDGTRPDGQTDNATKIRNFIIDAYNNWETEYVLLGGDGDGADVGGESGDNIIPARGLFDNREGTTDSNIPADLYYACLDGTFDGDGNGIYGEENDGTDKGYGDDNEIDLLSEVIAGRAPIDSTSELANFIEKTLAYETSQSQYLKRAYTVGEYLGFEGLSEYATASMEEIRKGSDWGGAGGQAAGFHDSGFFNTQTLYDSSSCTWDKSELINIMNNGVHVLNHLGHANVGTVMRLTNFEVENQLTNSDYFFIHTQGCYCGAFDNRADTINYPPNTYHNYDCIGEHFVAEKHGAFAYIGNSRYGFGMRNSTHGPSQYYQRQFWNFVFGEEIFNIGKANQYSKEDNIPYLYYSKNRWCHFELNLLGDPEVSFKVELSSRRAGIAAPAVSETVSGVISIIGTAIGDDLTGWRVECSTGESANGTNAVINDRLLFFDTTSFRDGEYTVKLICYYANGETLEDAASFKIDNFSIKLPEPISSSYSPVYDLYNCHDAIEIAGTAFSTHLMNYTISYGWGENPTEWHTDCVELINSGEISVVDGVLGYLHIRDINVTEANILTLKLDLHTEYFNDSLRVSIYVDPKLHKGWPLRNNGESITGVPYDINFDGSKEIIVKRHLNSGQQLEVYSSDGGMLSGWPVQLSDITYRTSFIPTVGDINNDGMAEIIFTDDYKVHIYDTNGNRVSGWPQSANGICHYGICTLANLDNDNDLEIITPNHDGWVNAWNYNGSPVEGQWPVNLNTASLVCKPVAVGDVDSDGKDEVFIASRGGKLFGLDETGEPLSSNWPISIGGEILLNPVLGDVDGDGTIDIVTGSKDYDANTVTLYVFSANGEVLNPAWWPVTINGRIDRNELSLTDLDRDGKLEIVAVTADTIHVFRYNGSIFDNWPLTLTDIANPDDYYLSYTPIMEDVNNDGYPEIIIMKNTPPYCWEIYAYDRNKEVVSGFPIRIPSPVSWYVSYQPGKVDTFLESHLSIADMDGDNKSELLVCARRALGADPNGYNALFLYDLDCQWSDTGVSWPYFYHDPKRTSFYNNRLSIDNIQRAIDESGDGSVIGMLAGTYEGNLVMRNKHNLTLTGLIAEEGKLLTTLKGSILCEGGNSKINNLKIEYHEAAPIEYNGYGYQNFRIINDAGITVINSESTIGNCVIEADLDTINYEGGYDPPLSHYGKGIQIWNLYGNPDISPMIENTEISNAMDGIYIYSQAFGGAILGEIKNNAIDSNIRGITLRMHKEKPFIRNNTISNCENGIYITYKDGSLLQERLNNANNNIFLDNIDDIWCDELGD